MPVWWDDELIQDQLVDEDDDVVDQVNAALDKIDMNPSAPIGIPVYPVKGEQGHDRLVAQLPANYWLTYVPHERVPPLMQEVVKVVALQRQTTLQPGVMSPAEREMLQTARRTSTVALVVATTALTTVAALVIRRLYKRRSLRTP